MVRKYTEEDVQQALNPISNGMSTKKAGLEYGVPRPTLISRMNGVLSRQEAHAHSTLR